MTKRPDGFAWSGFTPAQVKLLDRLDFIGNNGWARTEQTDRDMPKLLQALADDGVSFDQVRDAMAQIGYDRQLSQLDRWESKRMTGRFDG